MPEPYFLFAPIEHSSASIQRCETLLMVESLRGHRLLRSSPTDLPAFIYGCRDSQSEPSAIELLINQNV